MSKTITIIIADDHHCVTRGLKTMLADEAGIQVLAIARNGKELLHLAAELNPSVIITDICMPVMDGLEATRQLTQKHPHINIIAYTSSQEIYEINRLIKAGAKGYVWKGSAENEILEAIVTVNSGETYYCPGTLDKINKLKSAGHLFTKREYAILHYICLGKCDKEVAQLTKLHHRTVEDYKRKMRIKLGVVTTIEMVTYAMEHKYYAA